MKLFDLFFESKEINIENVFYKALKNSFVQVKKSNIEWYDVNDPQECPSFWKNYEDADYCVYANGFVTEDMWLDDTYIPESVYKKATKVFDDDLASLQRDFFKDNKDELEEYGIESPEDIDYNTLYDYGAEDLAKDWDSFWRDSLGEWGIVLLVNIVYNDEDDEIEINGSLNYGNLLGRWDYLPGDTDEWIKISRTVRFTKDFKKLEKNLEKEINLILKKLGV